MGGIHLWKDAGIHRTGEQIQPGHAGGCEVARFEIQVLCEKYRKLHWRA